MTYPTKKLGDIMDLKSGFAFKSSGFKSSGLPLIRIQNLKNNTVIINSKTKYLDENEERVKDFLLEEGDILIAMSGATTGKMARVPSKIVPAILNQRVGRVEVANDDVEKDFLWYLLHYLKPTIIDRAYGGAQPNVSFDKLADIEILLPPLAEQKKIVAKLDVLLGKIKEAKKLRAEAQEDTANLLPSALHKIFSEGKEKGWEEKRVEEVTEVVTKGTTPKTLGHEFTDHGVPFLRAESINGDVTPSSINRFISTETHEVLKRSKTKPGDVLMTIAGTIGRIGWVTDSADEMNMNQAVALIRPRKEVVLTKFLAHVLNGLAVKKQVESGTVSAAIPNFSLTMIKNINIPVPPLSEQKKIVKYFDSLSKKTRQIQDLQSQTAENFKSLEQSILHKAFSGNFV